MRVFDTQQLEERASGGVSIYGNLIRPNYFCLDTLIEGIVPVE